jgi:6-phosphogluconate dehydrogenase
MDIGIIGLGKMGAGMARRLLRTGRRVAVHTRDPQKVEALRREGAKGAGSPRELVQALAAPRVILLMLPAGEPTEDMVRSLADLLGSGDILIDGGNSHFKDDQRRAAVLVERGIRYLDAGVSGGIWGLEQGYCLMVGGDPKGFALAEPLLRDLAPEKGLLYVGPPGAGHFVKMVHNGIEYALMEAYAEGFELLAASQYGRGLNFAELAGLWNHGSVIRSWLLELLERAFGKDPRLESIRGWVEDTGEGRWTVQQAVESGVEATAIAHALFKRFDSRKPDLFSNRVLAALRAQFGGHEVKARAAT